MSLSTAKPSCPETQLIFGSDEFACWVVSWPQHALSRRSLSRAENECRLSEDLDPKPRTGWVWSCRGRGCSDQATARVFGKFGNSSFREHASFVSSWYSLWRSLSVVAHLLSACQPSSIELVGLPTGDNAAVSAFGAGVSSLLCRCIVLSADEDDLH